ncbi:MAG: CehA/McbA family metallohydrolase [Verrucomicrobiales bacterium]|nr:CehA/McbA family metallohydrolase [Verrucomicrobiales bacterium]
MVDAESGEPLACRVHLRADDGPWLFVQSGLPRGTALPYQEQWVPMQGVRDWHTTVSPHPFVTELQAGKRYRLEIERGKEYLPLSVEFGMPDTPTNAVFRLRRFANFSARGWFSGETHVHRRLVELTNVMEAEDLHVAFPVTFWTTRSDRPPDLTPSTLRSQGPSPFGPREDRGTAPIVVGPQRVVLPRNTEYEIFALGERRHTLGALFLLNHKSLPTLLAPPVRAIAERAHAEGALLDLDKHSWPWSLMLGPVAQVDLFELANNSVWRTRFGFNQSPGPLPDWMNVEREGPNTITEWGWLNYGFAVYYALLNSGFRLAPTAGTASGVHPVPLGHGRVYVHTGASFDLDAWLSGLKAGRSFVTTGPLLEARLAGQLPGHVFEFAGTNAVSLDLEIEAASSRPLGAIEILRNGRVFERHDTPSRELPSGGWSARVRTRATLPTSSWLAVRCVEDQPDGRKRFAHTGSWWVTLGGQPITPRREEAEWLVDRMRDETERQRAVLPPEALAEFEQALGVYRDILRRAR